MTQPFLPKTLGEWATTIALLAGAMWAWTTFYLSHTYASPVYVDTEIVKQSTAMTAQHMDMMKQFTDAVAPLRELPFRVTRLETAWTDHQTFTDEEKRTLKELNDNLVTMRTNEAVMITKLDTFREDEKLIIDRLNRLIGRPKPEGLSANP